AQPGDSLPPLGTQGLESRNGASLALVRSIVALEGRRAGQYHDLAHQVAEWAEHLRAAPEGQGAERIAVIAAVEADQDLASRLSDIDPILIGDLERDLDRG